MADAQAEADEILRQLAILLKKKRMRASDLFKKIDASGDGSLEGPELRDGLRTLGFEVSDQEFDLVMKKIDKDGGGDVSLKEFDRALRAAEKLQPLKRRESQKQKRGITSDDMEEFRQIFCLFKQLCRQRAAENSNDLSPELVEWDNSGTISVDELETLLESVGLHLDPVELQTMVREIDADNSGDIDFDEFASVLQKKIQVQASPDDIARSFKAFAKNAPNGLIKVKDLREALKTYLHKDMIDAEIDALLVHYADSFVKPAGDDTEYFNYMDYIDLMSAMVPPSE
uniref:Calmodulin n=1 Tax=Zooxanthella nutricula TaxID=1333877 RepID=A0A7S2VS77_9DINO